MTTAVQANWQELRRLSGILLEPSLAPGSRFAAADELYQFFLRLSDLDPSAPVARLHHPLAAGKALGATWAAGCIRDFQRTSAFLRGIFAAIAAARQRFPGEQIHVLYAGCGPFATLMTPLLPWLETGSATFTLLEVLPESVDCLQKLIATLHLTPWIKEVVIADATAYRSTTPVHIVVSEILQTGLQAEPQVAVTANLVPQLLPGGILIPECITVQPGLLHPGRNRERMMSLEVCREPVYHLFAPAFEWSAATIAAQEDLIFPEMEVDIPADQYPDFHHLLLFTRLRIFGEIGLDVWESALTQPLPLLRLEPGQKLRKIGLRYVAGAAPGFQFRVVA